MRRKEPEEILEQRFRNWSGSRTKSVVTVSVSSSVKVSVKRTTSRRSSSASTTAGLASLPLCAVTSKPFLTSLKLSAERMLVGSYLY